MISVKNSFEIAYNGTENECRFELYADTTSDLQGLTHIDGIKIQMGSECTDIATGDKYILNGSGAWILQPSDRAFSNVYTKPEIDAMITNYYTKTEADALFDWITVTFTTDTLPLSFISDGTPLTSVTIKGNGQQNGTPSPQNIVPFDGTGERTGNLWDGEYKENITFANGQYSVPTIYPRTIVYIPIIGGKTYSFSINNLKSGTMLQSVFSVNKPAIGGSYTIDGQSTFVNHGTDKVFTRTAPNEANWFAVQIIDVDNLANGIMFNTGSTALPYEPHGYKIPLTAASVTTPLYLGEVSTVRRIKKMILDGTETVTEESANVYSIPISDTVIAGAGVSTHFTYDASTADGQFKIESGKAVLGYDDTLENFKAFLAAQYAAGTPVVIWYVLASESTGIVNEPLYRIGDYCDELTTTTPIPTAKGSNTLSVDTTVQPSVVSITGGIRSE